MRKRGGVRQVKRYHLLIAALAGGLLLPLPWQRAARSDVEDARIAPEVPEEEPEEPPETAADEAAEKARERRERREREKVERVRKERKPRYTGPPRNWGVRAGLFLPSAAQDSAFQGSATLGGYYRGTISARNGLAYEIGGEAFKPKDTEDFADTTLFVIRADVVYGKWRHYKPGRSIYLAGGLALFMERTWYRELGTWGSAAALALDVGVGWSPFSSGLDIRFINLTLLMGETNVPLMLTANVGFLF